MQRRKYLKAVGAGALGTAAATGTATAATREWVDSYDYGDTGSYDSVNVEIYRAYYADGIYRYYARQAAENVFQQATDGGYISGYDITTWNIDWSVGDCTDIWSEWHDFRTTQTSWDSIGTHFLVTACGSDDLGNGSPVPTWDNDGSAYARTSGNDRPVDKFKHTVGMELLHSFIDKNNCCEVQDMTGPNNSEHSLGTVKDIDGQKLETPMATKGTWDVGWCDYDGDYKDGITMDTSYCSKQCLSYSADHADGRHSSSC